TLLGPADTVRTAQGLDNGQRDEFTCMLTGTKLACWGADPWGQLGQGVPAQHMTPVAVPPPTAGLSWQSVVLGRDHACATTSDGSAYCWGYDGNGAVRATVARGRNQPCIASAPCDAAT